MENDLILVKIESLRKCIMRIELKRPASPEILRSDIDLQDIISVNLERAIQQCVDIASIIISDTEAPPPSTMASSFTALADCGIIEKQLSEKLGKAVGFRNIAVHEYDKINWDLVYSIITYNIDNFRLYISVILEYMETHKYKQ